MQINLWLFIVLTVLQVADIETTAEALQRGIGREANPLVAGAIRTLGVIPGLMLVKLVVLVPAYLSAITPLSDAWLDTLQTAILAALVVWYIAVVVHNIRVLRRH